MRTAVYYNNNDIRLEDKEIPTINENEILVKVMASGVCGSDVMEWYRLSKAPLVLGHEITGIVEKTGSHVKKFKQGDRVSVSHHVPCNTCYYCLQGKHTVCKTLQTTNFDPGGFSEFLRVPQINVDRGTFILPNEISFDDGVFIEPLGCVIRGLRSAGFKTGDTVLVLGSGISGLLFIQHAKASNAGNIIATDINQYRLDKALKLGADKVIHASQDISKEVLKTNNNRLADLVIVCTGAISAFKQALQCVDKGGTILCFAPTAPDTNLSIPLNQFWRNSITMLPSYASSPYDSEMAIRLIASKRIDVNNLITHKINLADTKKGFQLVAEANESIKVIVEPQN